MKEREQADDKEILGENVFMFEGENVKRQMDRSKICVECIGASNHRRRPPIAIGLPDLGNGPREQWFEKDDSDDLVVKAGVAHLWFVTIHPFDDGKGRIARAIADMVLARSEHSAKRFYSMSAQIRQERKAYYEILESTQKGNLDITAWLEWFIFLNPPPQVPLSTFVASSSGWSF